MADKVAERSSLLLAPIARRQARVCLESPGERRLVGIADLIGDVPHRDGVDAITLVRRRRAIREHVPQVGTALRADRLGARRVLAHAHAVARRVAEFTGRAYAPEL